MAKLALRVNGGSQTLSRTLHEEIVYDRDGVTTADWASYPILTFPEVPALEFELIQRLDQPPLGVGEARKGEDGV